MADYLNIAGRVRTTASDGVAMEAQEVKDLNLNKSQQEINADVQTELGDRYTKEETYSKEQLNELITTPDVNYVSVVATNATTAVTDILPASGEADTIYRIGNWNGTQYDPTMYALYAWNGSAYVCLAVRSFVGEVYDISVNHPDGLGNPTPYADLAAALGTSGANIPADIRRGGMSIKFIQGTVQSSDNKYVQYRCMANTFTTDVTQWQGVDDEPTAESKNIVESGGVEKYLAKEKTTVQTPSYQTGCIRPNGTIDISATSYGYTEPILIPSKNTIYLNLGNIMYLGYDTAVLCKTDSTGTFIETLIQRAFDTDRNRELHYTNTSSDNIYVRISGTINPFELGYIITGIPLEAASKESLNQQNLLVSQNFTPSQKQIARNNIKALIDTAVDYVSLNTNATDANKVISNAKEGYTIDSNNIYIVRLYTSNTADSCTLNINNTGAKALYYNYRRASSTNTWMADSYALLVYNGEEYYLLPLQTKQEHEWAEQAIAKMGITSSSKYSAFIKEMYLTGLNDADTYILSYIRKDSAPSNIYGFKIAKEGAISVDLAAVYVNSETKESFVTVDERNSSGISGYAIVDWTQIDYTGSGESMVNNPTVTFNSFRIKNIEFSPTIALKIKENSRDIWAVQNVINTHKYWVRATDGELVESVTDSYVIDATKLLKIKAYLYNVNSSYVSAISFFSTKLPSQASYMSAYTLIHRGKDDWFETTIPDGAVSVVCTTYNADGLHEPVILGVEKVENSDSLGLSSTKYNTYINDVSLQAHTFMNNIEKGNGRTIPPQSIYDLNICGRLGFKSMEGNCAITADGKFIVMHGVNLKLGYQLIKASVDQDTADLTDDANYDANTPIASLTLQQLRENYVYKSVYPKMRTPVITMEEFVIGCRDNGMIPILTYWNNEQVEIIRSLIGERFIMRHAPREVTNAPIIDWEWDDRVEPTVENAVKVCREYRSPFILGCGYSILANKTDAEIQEMVDAVHNEGCYICCDINYYTEINRQRLLKLGFDSFTSDWEVPFFDSGNLQNLSAMINFADFGHPNDSVLNLLDSEQVISNNGTEVLELGKAMLHILFIGTIKIVKLGKIENQTFTSDGNNYMTFSSYLFDSRVGVTIESVGSTTIKDMTYKVSKC